MRKACIPILVAFLSGGCLAPRGVERTLSGIVARAAEDEPAATAGIVSNALAVAETAPVDDAPLTLDLDTSLRLASRHSRELQGRREQLQRSGLSLMSTRRSFGVELSSTQAYVLQRDEEGDESRNGSLDVTAARILPTGGRVSLSGGLDTRSFNSTNGTDTTYDSRVSARLEQPLLAGAGYATSHETFIQAEQDMLYALRSFALDRQDFAIRILRQYNDLLIQRAVLANTRLNVSQSTALRERSEAMFKVNRAPAIDVLRAQQQELSAQNQLGREEATFDIQLRRFLLALGMPVERQAELTGEIPPLVPVGLDQAACIARALERRADLRTTRDRVTDAARGLRRARSLLMPELNVYGQVTMAGDETDSLGDQDLQDRYEAGVSLEIPLDRRDERDAVKLAALDLAAARRARAEKEDEVRLEVTDSFTQLNFLANAVAIEKRNIDIAERRARNASIRFRNGELLNRDVVEAENELLDARNAYARVLAQYGNQRIELLRNTGLLDITPQGLFVEMTE